MLLNDLPDVESAMAADPQPLCEGSLQLLKSEGADEDAPWKFAGIASDEDADVDGDKILRKALDLSYAQQRGFVNWDHSRQPADQIGFITHAKIVDESSRELIAGTLGILLSKSASVYMEGEFYKSVAKATEVHSILKSTPAGHPGLGLSLDGVMARDLKNGGVVKAFVRGVAITPVPTHPKTLLRLRKSLQGYDMLGDLVQVPADLSAAIAAEVVAEIRKSVSKSEGMSTEDATLWVLKRKPHWTYEFASQVVQYSIANSQRG